jgi:putative tryptophan/tyrosine transport system substrate-binding protein
MKLLGKALIASALAAMSVMGAGERMAYAQGAPANGKTVPKLGILAISDADSIDAMMEGLGALGWADGKTLQVVYPKATQDLAALAGNMQRLLDAHVDVIVAQTKPAVMIARKATGDIPIVMGAFNGDPVKDGLVKSVERPGTNVTGTYYNITSGAGDRVGVLTDLLPAMKHVGIVFNPDSEASIRLFQELETAAQTRGLIVTKMPVRGGAEVDRAFAAAKADGVEGVVTVTAAEMFAIRKEVAAAQIKHRLPTVMGSIGFPELGGLAKLGPEIPALWTKMVPTVDRLLRHDAQPGDIALITVDGFQLDINLATAQTLGVTVPPALLQRAVRVIR